MGAKPIPAVGLASALVQVVDFGINTLRKDHGIYRQPPGDSDDDEAAIAPEDGNSAVLQDIIDNLWRLTDLIDQSELKKLQDEKSGQKKGAAKLSEAAQQLLKHSEQVREIVEDLRDALIAAQGKGHPEQKIWLTARDALLNGTWKKKDVTNTKKKLRALRREVDTSLLLALRQYLDHSVETGLPVYSQDTSDSPLRHWEKWQNTALDAIHTNDWRPSKKKNIEDFAKIVDALIVAENEAYFGEQVFKLLHFDEIDERLHAVASPAEGSMLWLFNDERMQDEGGFLDFLSNTRGEHLFWLTGRPGSGKSVLMKHIFRNAQVFEYLEAWSGSAPGITAAYMYWNSGSKMQKSAVGLLRTILYESLQDMIFGPLEQGEGILRELFSERWECFKSYGGGLHDFKFKELRRAFEKMVADTEKKFLFMIDGLDEVDGLTETDEYAGDVVDLILATAKRENVKMIVSAWDSSPYTEVFHDRPKLTLDDWTRRDSQAHILRTFDEWEGLKAMRRKSDNVEEMNVVNTLAEKADGVYLWAKLATRYILQKATEVDDFTKLRFRAGELPHTLDDLLEVIVETLADEDAEQLWGITTLLESHEHASPDIIPLSLALKADIKATNAKPLKTKDITKYIEDMQDLTTRQCTSLISIFDTSPPEHDDNDTLHQYLKVSYTHLTIRRFLVARQPQPNMTLDPVRQWAAAHLHTLKQLPPSSSAQTWPAFSACLESALQLYDATQKYPLSYIDAASSTALTQHTKSPTSTLPSFPSPATQPTSPLAIAAFLNLREYIAITLKAKAPDRKEVRHAVDFSREMCKRLGKGGEMCWLSGQGRKRLREVYGSDRTETDALLAGYARSVRFSLGSRDGARSAVDLPAYE